MKLDVHSNMIGIFASKSFLKSIEDFAKSLVAEDKNIKKVQLYSDFCSPNGEYPFIYNDIVYYPATLVYKSEKWKIQWICWNKNDIIKKVSTTFPYATVDTIDIFKCDIVPEKFNDMILNKTLFFSQKSNYASPEMGEVDLFRDIGKINTAFLDELSRQISEKLMELAECDLSPKWSISISTIQETVSVDGVNYCLIELKNYNAECMSIGVCWNGNYDVCDYITRDNIKFELTEFKFHDGRIHSLEEISAFVKNGGYHYLHKNKLNYPDVTLDFQLKNTVDNYEKNKILAYIEKYVASWNNNENNEDKIHDCFLIDGTSDKVFSIYLDFGNCDPVALKDMIDYFYNEYIVGNRGSENIEKISLEHEVMLYDGRTE